MDKMHYANTVRVSGMESMLNLSTASKQAGVSRDSWDPAIESAIEIIEVEVSQKVDYSDWESCSSQDRNNSQEDLQTYAYTD